MRRGRPEAAANMSQARVARQARGAGMLKRTGLRGGARLKAGRRSAPASWPASPASRSWLMLGRGRNSTSCINEKKRPERRASRLTRETAASQDSRRAFSSAGSRKPLLLCMRASRLWRRSSRRRMSRSMSPTTSRNGRRGRVSWACSVMLGPLREMRAAGVGFCLRKPVSPKRVRWQGRAAAAGGVFGPVPGARPGKNGKGALRGLFFRICSRHWFYWLYGGGHCEDPAKFCKRGLTRTALACY